MTRHLAIYRTCIQDTCPYSGLSEGGPSTWSNLVILSRGGTWRDASWFWDPNNVPSTHHTTETVSRWSWVGFGKSHFISSSRLFPLLDHRGRGTTLGTAAKERYRTSRVRTPEFNSRAHKLVPAVSHSVPAAPSSDSRVQLPGSQTLSRRKPFGSRCTVHSRVRIPGFNSRAHKP